jgi:SAM-dependent methyltransferase
MSSTLKKRLQEILWPLMPGWPDEGRRIVQGPHLQAFLKRATGESRRFSRVFNAGSGEGGYSPLMLKLPGVTKAFESDFSYTRHLPSRIDPRQVFFGASLASVPLADRTIDLILCTEVLEHIEDHERALDEITRVLVPNGWLLITVPTPPAPPDPNHVREGYRPEELGGMLRQRGFEVVETRFCMRYFFRFLLSHWSRFPVWCPRIVIRAIALLDRLLPLGPPMDLLMLARLSGKTPGEFGADSHGADSHDATKRQRVHVEA